MLPLQRDADHCLLLPSSVLRRVQCITHEELAPQTATDMLVNLSIRTENMSCTSKTQTPWLKTSTITTAWHLAYKLLPRTSNPCWAEWPVSNHDHITQKSISGFNPMKCNPLLRKSGLGLWKKLCTKFPHLLEPQLDKIWKTLPPRSFWLLIKLLHTCLIQIPIQSLNMAFFFLMGHYDVIYGIGVIVRITVGN